MVLKVQAITYPRTSCIRLSSAVSGPYLTNVEPIKPDQIIPALCRVMAAMLKQCWVIRVRVLMAVEVVFLI